MGENGCVFSETVRKLLSFVLPAYSGSIYQWSMCENEVRGSGVTNGEEEAEVGGACGEEDKVGGACGEEDKVGGACGEEAGHVTDVDILTSDGEFL